MRPLPQSLVLGALLALGGLACAATAVSVEHGWSRPTPPGVSVGVGYLELVNTGNADRLVAVASPRAARVEMHESRLEGGVSRMHELRELPVPAAARVAFAPDGRHLMLLGLKAPLVGGERVPLVLTFAVAGTVRAELAVVEAGAAAAPRRIVTLAPHLTELVYAAGAGERLVGTLDTSDFPAAAKAVPRIGDVTHIDAERLLALRPDLVLIWGDGSPAEQHALLARLKLPVLSLEQHRLADVADALERLGREFGTQPVANAAAARLRGELRVLAERYATARRLRVFYQVWGSPLYTLGGTHVASEMLRVCGADNLFADQPRSSFMVNEESVYARDPDVVALAGTRAEAAEWRARWGSHAPLRAVAAGNVIVLDPDLVNRMGPRIAAGTAVLCDALDSIRRRPPGPLRR